MSQGLKTLTRASISSPSRALRASRLSSAAALALAFVPDHLMDEPEQTRQGLREAYLRLSELDFDHLLLAHGEPFVGDGREALRAFASG